MEMMISVPCSTDLQDSPETQGNGALASQYLKKVQPKVK